MTLYLNDKITPMIERNVLDVIHSAEEGNMDALVIKHKVLKGLLFLRELSRARRAAWAMCRKTTTPTFTYDNLTPEERETLSDACKESSHDLEQVTQAIAKFEIELLQLEISLAKSHETDYTLLIRWQEHELLERRLKMLNLAREKLELGIKP